MKWLAAPSVLTDFAIVKSVAKYTRGRYDERWAVDALTVSEFHRRKDSFG